MKRYLTLVPVALLFLFFALSMVSPAQAAISVILDGSQLAFDSPPVIKQGTTLVPLRAIFEALEATVEWDGATKTVTASKEGTTIRLTIGSTVAYKNGGPVQLTVPGQLINGRTMVPLRFISEALGAQVSWEGATKTITINSGGGGSGLGSSGPTGVGSTGAGSVSWEHPAKLFSLSLPAGWKVERGSSGIGWQVTGQGATVILTPYPAKGVNTEYFRTIADNQMLLLGQRIQWKEKSFGDSKAYLGSSTLTNRTIGYRQDGDFVFEAGVFATGDDAEKVVFQVLGAVKTSSKLSDPTGGNTGLLNTTWVASQSAYSDVGTSYSDLAGGGGGGTDKWTFYSDGTVKIDSFTGFLGGSGSGYWSASESSSTVVKYWIADGVLYLYGVDGFMTVPVAFGANQLQIGNLVLSKSVY